MTLFCNPLLCRKGWQASFTVLPLLRPMPLELKEASQALEGGIDTGKGPHMAQMQNIVKVRCFCMIAAAFWGVIKQCRQSAPASH